MIVVRYILRVHLVVVRSFFFFKQKTAYEMRISDWSSDVCSSDLRARWQSHRLQARGRGQGGRDRRLLVDRMARQANPRRGHGQDHGRPHNARHADALRRQAHDLRRLRADRSEEHTSELQSLMRISYAVFCLQKKTKTTNKHN